MNETIAQTPAAKRQLRHKHFSWGTWHLVASISPGVLWIVIFLVVPSISLIGIAFMTSGVYGLPQMPFTLDAFKQLAGYTILGWSSSNLDILYRTAWQAVLTTTLVVILSYPIAYYITTKPARLRPLLLMAVVAPSWTNQVSRVLAWINLFAPDTVFSGVAAQLGFILPTMGLYPSSFAVSVALVYNFLPFMVLPLYASFERLDYAQVEAARDLFAGSIRTFFHSVVPQTLPGLISGMVLVLIPAFGMFVIPELLGGGKSMMLGNLVAHQFTVTANWPYGAAGALIMIIATLLGLLVLRRVGRRLGGGDEVVL